MRCDWTRCAPTKADGKFYAGLPVVKPQHLQVSDIISDIWAAYVRLTLDHVAAGRKLFFCHRRSKDQLTYLDIP